MVVLLDGKCFETALPDMAAAMIVLVVAANMGGEQPHHVVAQFAVTAWPEREVEMVGHQAIPEQTHPRRSLPGLAQQLDKGGEIASLVKHGAAAVSSVEYVVTVAALGRTGGSRHGVIIGLQRDKGKNNVRCPLFFPGCITTAWGSSERSARTVI